MDYHWLSAPEVQHVINPICSKEGWPQLNINVDQPTNLVRGAFEDGNLVGFLAMQLFPMLGPAWVDPAYRDGTVSRQMADHMHEFLRSHEARGYLVVADNAVTERLCERYAMKRVESPVYMAVSKL